MSKYAAIEVPPTVRSGGYARIAGSQALFNVVNTAITEMSITVYCIA